jgi:sec-independent protein translocase protein TatA
MIAIVGGIGVWEALLVLFVILLLFGARRLPELGRAIGASIRAARDAVGSHDAKATEEPGELEPGKPPEDATPPEPERGRTDPRDR